MTEPSTKARELVKGYAAEITAAVEAGYEEDYMAEVYDAESALLTYIADLEAIAEREQERRDLHE